MSPTDLVELTSRIHSLHQELNGLRPLNPLQEKRIMDKFRLDWNYHSNNIEGNRLTYGETKALLLYGITAQNKPLKDHLEIKGHNEALLWLEEVIGQQRPLTESFARELHALLLKEPYQVDAITPDGNPTKRWIQIGQYKSTPNHVRTVTGEIFYFASPEETPAQVHDLFEWYRSEKKNTSLPGWVLAASFHYKFIRIHPFDDGNGRMARILMNFILMQYGLPPVIIKTKEKEDYFSALRQADTGNLEAFILYIGQQVVYSTELMLKGAKGENIEEEDDLDKEIALLKAKLNEKEEVKLSKEDSVLSDLFRDSILPLFEALRIHLLKFNEFFYGSEFQYRINNLTYEVLPEDVLSRIKEMPNFIEMGYRGKGFKKAGTQAFDIYMDIRFILDNYVYKIVLDRDSIKPIMEKLYHQQLTPQEIKQIAADLARQVLENIKRNVAR